jgi:predicted TPR repeat methyltransferase
MEDKNEHAVEIYNAIAEDYAKKYDPIDGEEDLVFLNAFLAHLKQKSFVVDIGCGTGFSSGYFTKKGFERTIDIIKTYLKPGGIFGLVIQEGKGEIETPEPFLPGQKIYIHLYTESEIHAILEKHGFEVVEQRRRAAKHPSEFSFNKLLFIAKFIT